MKFDFIKVDNRNEVAILTINDPPANTLTYDLIVQLEQVYLEILLNPVIKAIVITGNGERFFSGGVNIGMLQSVTPHYNSNFILYAAEVLERIEHSPLPIVAAINGHITGGGLELALIAKRRVAVEGTYNIGFPEVRLGVIPGLGGTQRLLQLTGTRAALDLITQGSFLSVAEAHSLGIVDELLPKEGFLEQAIAYTRVVLREWEMQRNRASGLASWKSPDKSIVSYARSGRIGVITITDACRHSPSLDVIWALNEAILEARLDEAVQALLVTHEGADLRLGNDPELSDFVWDYAHFVFGRFENYPRICVLAFEGTLGPLETELALACDYRFMPLVAEGALHVDARSRRQSRYGVDIDQQPRKGGVFQFKRLVDGGMIKIADSSDWREWVLNWMTRFVPPKGASMAIGYAKLAIVKGSSLPIEAGMLLERHLQEQLFRSHDGPQGMKAYLEKRAPVFQGE